MKTLSLLVPMVLLSACCHTDMITCVYRLQEASHVPSAWSNSTPDFIDMDASSTQTLSQTTFTEFFESMGVSFPEGAYLTVDTTNRAAIHHNTRENQNRMRALTHGDWILKDGQ